MWRGKVWKEKQETWTGTQEALSVGTDDQAGKGLKVYVRIAKKQKGRMKAWGGGLA